MSHAAASAVHITWTQPRPGRQVATVTVDRAAKLNTLTSALIEEFAAGVGRLSEEPELAAVVLTGAGERAFIGGADIAEMAQLTAESARRFITGIHQCCSALRALPVPVIARIQGYALGAGMEIAAACDLRVASSAAVFGMPEVRIGIPSVIEAALLPTLIGWGRAREVLLLGQTFSAEQAAAWGLVERVVPPGDLDAAVGSCVGALLDAGPNAIRIQKRLIQDWERLSVEGAIAAGIDAFVSAWSTDEPRRMMGAFLDSKRRPK
ncbi:MAG: enoyl-CoA hydratase/isomerase family protein [Acetobacteraceae bacterium]|nr:enoyl-CoA hydratase/isomerase family protein [Acetobacteraceae bacterium]